jgi:pyochelin synthetase
LFRRQTPRDLAAYYAEKDQPPRATVATGPPALGLIDPAARLAFRDSRPGLRRIDGAGPSIGLVASAADQTLARGYLIRRTHRAFSPHPVPFDRFGCLLECLKPVVLDGRPKYLYGSAGALYPNQVYIHSKPGRVEGVPAGTYYYHPAEHRLVPLAAGVELDRDLHVPFVNQPVFDQAAFSLFIVAELGAIAPEYGDWSMHFATIEAGLMTQLLETAAGSCGIGLCQIGSIEFDRIRDLFQLGATHRLIHSLVGGSAQSEEGLL